MSSRNPCVSNTLAENQLLNEDLSGDTREAWVSRAVAAATASLRAAVPPSETVAANDQRDEWNFNKV